MRYGFQWHYHMCRIVVVRINQDLRSHVHVWKYSALFSFFLHMMFFAQEYFAQKFRKTMSGHTHTYEGGPFVYLKAPSFICWFSCSNQCVGTYGSSFASIALLLLSLLHVYISIHVMIISLLSTFCQDAPFLEKLNNTDQSMFLDHSIQYTRADD